MPKSQRFYEKRRQIVRWFSRLQMKKPVPNKREERSFHPDFPLLHSASAGRRRASNFGGLRRAMFDRNKDHNVPGKFKYVFWRLAYYLKELHLA